MLEKPEHDRGQDEFFPRMKRTPAHPINPYIRNTFVGDFYLNLARSGRFYRLRRILEHVLGTEIPAQLPERLYIPHPYGIIVGAASKIEQDVTLMQFCLLGGKDPWYEGGTEENLYPALKEGVYVSAGAKVLGPVTIGAWSVIGANAVVTEDVPPFSTVVGNNRILPTPDGGPPAVKQYLESRKKGLP
jgi:serine acetyltransferase